MGEEDLAGSPLSRRSLPEPACQVRRGGAGGALPDHVQRSLITIGGDVEMVGGLLQIALIAEALAQDQRIVGPRGCADLQAKLAR